MDRAVNDGFKFNKETEFIPIAGMAEEQLNSERKEISIENKSDASSIQDNHHPALLAILSEELSIAPEEIHDFELYAFALNVRWQGSALIDRVPDTCTTYSRPLLRA